MRNHSTVRSILTGFVAAFDKHLNLALVDVDEAICLRKDDIKSTTLTPEQDLRDLPPVHNEQDYLAIANAVDGDLNCDLDGEYESVQRFSTTAVNTEEASNEKDRIDGELAAQKALNDSEETYSNNDGSHDHSPSETNEGASAAEAKKVQIVSEELSDEKTPALQAGSDLIDETKQESRDSEEPRPEEKHSEELLTMTESLTIVASADVVCQGEKSLKNIKKKNRHKYRGVSNVRGRKNPPVLSQRFISQLFVRGEQIVMIAFADI